MHRSPRLLRQHVHLHTHVTHTRAAPSSSPAPRGAHAFHSSRLRIESKSRAAYSTAVAATASTTASASARVTAEGMRRALHVSAAEWQFGQPVHETHPHLLRAGELTQGITAQEYYDRRQKLASLMPDGSVAVLPAAEVKYRSGPVFYPFYQNSDFLYLTGFLEPEALAVIDKRSSETVFHLLVREKNEQAELWDGARSGTQAAVDVFNADESSDIANVTSALNKILAGAKHVYTDVYPSARPKTQLSRYLQGSSTPETGFIDKISKLKREGVKVHPLKTLMSKLRVIKSDAEVENMRLAGKHSGRAITDAMRQGWSTEKELHAYLDSMFRLRGCESEAYVPVIAGGKNALSIHYTRNDAVIKDNDLILVDAGGSYGGYITDITRTWPSSGAFSAAQKDLYEALLRVQRTCVSLCRQSANMTLDEIHQAASRSLRDGLRDLGFDVSGDAMDTLFPHHVGHYIGLDVHDTPEVSRKEKLASNMCITIEPGVYVPDHPRWPSHFRGMGIRIEDSICVQDDHPLVLTTEAVKEPEDVEALRH